MKITDAEVSGLWIPEQLDLRPEGERAGWCCTCDVMGNIKDYRFFFSKLIVFIVFIYGEKNIFIDFNGKSWFLFQLHAWVMRFSFFV